VIVIGAGGSNQVVASLIHGSKMNLKFAPLWARDEPDFDNTLNMLSTLSVHPGKHYEWGSVPAVLKRTWGFYTHLRDSIVLGPGGWSPAGVLGQVSGCLELAEQISAGAKDVDRIYLPVGSSCTITGLIMGVVLARWLKLKAFQKPNLTLVGVAVHQTHAKLQRILNLHKTTCLSIRMPLSICHTLHHTCVLLKSLGGPDIEQECLKFLQNHVMMCAEKDVVGEYGTHSVKSILASQAYDKTGKVVDEDGKPAPHIWICGHFVGKALCVLLRDLEKDPHANYLLWQTKSAIQPRGSLNEFEAMSAMSKPVREWADKGKAWSSLRQGKFNTSETASSYRDFMTEIDHSASKIN